MKALNVLSDVLVVRIHYKLIYDVFESSYAQFSIEHICKLLVKGPDSFDSVFIEERGVSENERVVFLFKQFDSQAFTERCKYFVKSVHERFVISLLCLNLVNSVCNGLEINQPLFWEPLLLVLNQSLVV